MPQASLGCFLIIQKYQDFEPKAVKLGGEWVVGYGHVGDDVKPHMEIDGPTAIEWLWEDIKQVERIVKKLVKVRLSQNQYDAIVSFTFSMGSAILKSSNLLKFLNKGKYIEAGDEFRRFCFVGIRRSPELVKRREEERRMFLYGIYS